ncbi:MAG: hypothetical protein FJW32_04575 [Acidobacteria bacterium]|nr:hypothetical protein [Acidobacteriota bacterium]
MAALFLLLITVASGFALVRAIWPAPWRWSAADPIRLALAPVAGLGLASILFYLVRIAAGLPPMAAAGAMLGAAGVAGVVARKRATAEEAPGHSGKAPFWIWVLLAAAAALSIFTVTMMTSIAPHGEWDAWSVWNLRARFLVRAANMQIPFVALLDWSHPDYPLMVPASIAMLWSACGTESQPIAAWVQALFLISAIAVPFTVLRYLRGAAIGAIAAIAIIGGSTIVRMTAAMYADVPMAAMIVCSGAMAVLALESEPNGRGPAILAGLVAALGAWTKNEGMLFFGVLAGSIAFVAASRAELTARLGKLRDFAIGAAPVLAVVFYFKSGATVTNDLVGSASGTFMGRLADTHRHWVTFWAMAGESLTFGNYVVPPAIVFGVWLGVNRLRRPLRGAWLIPIFAAVAQLAGYYVVYIGGSTDIHWQIDNSVARIMMHVWPLCLFGVFLITAPIEKE